MDGLPTGTVTFLFTDLGSSTRLWEDHGDAMGTALARHDQLLATAVASHDGYLVKTTGDGVHAAFATADAAVAAALDAQRALSAEPWGPTGALRVRMGMHSGGAELRDGDYYGPTLNRAARLMSIAHPGQILCSQTTADLVRDLLPPGAALLELGVHQLRDLTRPEALSQLTHPDIEAEFPPLGSPGSQTMGNLPRQVTSLIGREDELARTAAELEHTTVVTLTGVGGVGKTRLALEVAERIRPSFRDGAWLVELAGVREAEQVPEAVLDSFTVERRHGLTTAQTLVEFLRNKELLLVVDNCEHVLRASARLVSEIVRDCAGVRIIATSREGLNVAGERIFVVTSLDVPDESSAPDAVTLAGSDAIRLFVDRAQAVRAGFAVDSGNAAAIAQVCRRLDGVPLAIELAAARVGMLTPAELAVRLDQRFRVLTGSERGVVERHQTLRAAIDWSYDLLDDRERHVLDRFSVFAGGFTIEAAEAVAPGGDIDAIDVFDVLAVLVGRSLVVAEADAQETRYRLLETIRQYAQERLDADGDTPAARDAHARYYAGLAETAVVHFTGPEESKWLRRLIRDLDNIRVALAWATEGGDADSALRILGLETTGLVVSGEIGQVIYRAAEPVLAIAGVEENPRYPIALVCAAVHRTYRGDWDAADRFCDEAEAAERRLGVAPGVAVWGARAWIATNRASTELHLAAVDELIRLGREQGPATLLAVALAQRALSRSLRGDDLQVAREEIDEALALARRAGAPTPLVSVLGFAAFVLVDEEPVRARALMEEAIAVKELHWVRLPLYSMMGDVAQRLGDRSLALEYFTRGLGEQYWLGYVEMIGRMLRRVAILLVHDAPRDAAVISGAVYERSPVTMTERVVELWAEAMSALDASLGESARVDLQNQGAALSDREIVTLATRVAEQVRAGWDGSGDSADSG